MMIAKLTSSSIALAALLMAGNAQAAPHRSGGDLPQSSSSGHGRSASSLPDHVGPKNGFKDNHGIEEAYEHSDEHSAHHRHDSPGC